MTSEKLQKVALSCVVAFTFIGCDRVTKGLAKTHLMYGEPHSFFYDTVRLLYVENTGAALSLGDNMPQPYSFIFLSLLPIIVLVGLTVYTLNKLTEMSTLQMLSYPSLRADLATSLTAFSMTDTYPIS